MNIYVKKALILIFLVLIISMFFEILITKKLNSGYRYRFQSDWHDLKNHNADILFVGNSRIYRHIDPLIIKHQLNKKCEIIASTGQSIDFLWFKFRQYISVNKLPKEIYLQFDPYFLIQRNDLYGLKNFNTIFFINRIKVDELVNYHGYSIYYKYLPLAAIDIKFLIKFLINDTVKNNQVYENSYGSLIESVNWQQENWFNPPATNFIAKNYSNYLDSFLLFSKRHNIRLYPIYTPQSYTSYLKFNRLDSLNDILNYLSIKYNYKVELLNFNSIKYNDSIFFYNHMHMNEKGVRLFMNDFLKSNRTFKQFK